MKVDTENLFGGSLGWGRISTQKAVSDESGIDQATLTRVKQGKEGFGPVASKLASKLANAPAVDIYVSSQVRSAKQRFESGEINHATATRVVGKILGGLKEFEGATVAPDVAKSLTEFASEVAEHEISGATKSNQMDRLGRDGSGLKVSKKYGGGQGEETTANKSNANGTYGALGRSLDGTSRKKAM